jgi:hypothetical protein
MYEYVHNENLLQYLFVNEHYTNFILLSFNAFSIEFLGWANRIQNDSDLFQRLSFILNQKLFCVFQLFIYKGTVAQFFRCFFNKQFLLVPIKTRLEIISFFYFVRQVIRHCERLSFNKYKGDSTKLDFLQILLQYQIQPGAQIPWSSHHWGIEIPQRIHHREVILDSGGPFSNFQSLPHPSQSRSTRKCSVKKNVLISEILLDFQEYSICIHRAGIYKCD